MITRVPDGATRAESVAWDKLVFTVAVGDDNSLAIYEQAKQAFATITWDEWVDRANPPMRACLAVTLEGRDLVEVLVTAVRS